MAPAPFQNESEQFISSNRATTGALDPHHANSLGISVVYQELSLCPNLSAAENIALHQAADTNFLHRVDRKQLNLSAQELLCRLGLLNLDVTEPIRSFNLGQRQLVEIAKALTTRLRVLFRDEPNSALTSDESAHLFRAVRELRQQGIAIVYVSHRLEETMQLADRITILRDGQLVDTAARQNFSIPQLIQKMVGREVNYLFHRDPLRGCRFSDPGPSEQGRSRHRRGCPRS